LSDFHRPVLKKTASKDLELRGRFFKKWGWGDYAMLKQSCNFASALKKIKMWQSSSLAMTDIGIESVFA